MITKIGISGNLLIVSTKEQTNGNSNISSRGVIERFTESSGRRMRRYLRDSCVDYKYMHTLTYPKQFPTDGIVFKEDLRQYCQAMRRYVRKNGTEKELEDFSAFWFMEFQSRGAVHYHLFTNFRFPSAWCAQRWYEICNSGDELHRKAGTRVESLRSGREGTISYASKYANKQYQKNIPSCVKNAGRFWGIYGNRDCVSAHTNTTDNTNEKVHKIMFSVLSRIEKMQNEQMLKKIAERISHTSEFGDYEIEVGFRVYKIENRQALLEIAREIAVLDRWGQHYREMEYCNAFLYDGCAPDLTEDDWWPLKQLIKDGFM